MVKPPETFSQDFYYIQQSLSMIKGYDTLN